MDEDEARLLRVSIGMLARQLRELVVYVQAVLAVLKLGPSEAAAQMIQDMDKDLLELEASVARIAEAFPEEFPGGSGSNGGRR